MRVITWTDRLFDESNLWLRALQAEEEGQYAQAAIYYLTDSEASLKHDLLVKAALSCSCAASCIARTGDLTHSQRLYREAAALYQENAYIVMGESVRETLWSLREACRCFFSANDKGRAEEIRRIISSLAGRVDPFTGEAEVDQLADGAASVVLKTGSLTHSGDNARVAKVVQEFLMVRKSMPGRKTSIIERVPLTDEGGDLYAESIVSKLG